MLKLARCVNISGVALYEIRRKEFAKGRQTKLIEGVSFNGLTRGECDVFLFFNGIDYNK